MGIRSDLAIAYSKEGWEEMEEYFSSLSENDQGMIFDLIQDADQRLCHSDGSRLLSWLSIKSDCADMMLLITGHNQLDSADYYSVEMYDCGGDEEILGEYYDNPFGICMTRSIFINADDCSDFHMEDLAEKLESLTGNSAPAKPVAVVIVDDYTCPVCGNTKCSTNEKSCWKCGSPI